jgi:hypothetical protein
MALEAKRFTSCLPLFFPSLLSSSGFQNTIVFERDLLPGGMIYTSENSDDLPRELSAAFLSPDSGEMTALVSRFDLSLLAIGLDAISYRQASHNTSSHEDLILTPVQWYEHALPLVTGENDSQTNSEIVFTALERYTLVHMEIFGTYLTRLPPRPASYAQLQMLKGTFLEFLQRHDLLALLPMMFQVFSVKVLSLPCLAPFYLSVSLSLSVSLCLSLLFQWKGRLPLSEIELGASRTTEQLECILWSHLVLSLDIALIPRELSPGAWL